jgi:hypothetical protein
MARNLSIPAVVGALFLTGAQLMAGGPPRLCLPVDGVNSGNAEACTRRLTGALGDKVDRLELRQNEAQWYALFRLARDVRLSEVEAALAGSPFSVPRDRLRLFGHVTLEVENGAAKHDKLTGDLGALKYVSVGESDNGKGVLLVTVDMPYPEDAGRETAAFGRVPFARQAFRRTDFSSGVATKSEQPASADTLPSYIAMRDALAKHDARLKDLRWSANLGCRMLGCVSIPAAPGA